MSGLMVPILAFLLAGGLASAWLLGIRLRREQQSSGILALAGMHWREFQRLVLEVMRRRGYRQSSHADTTEDDALLELEHQGDRWLLSTKHGAAYAPGPAAIAEFASHLQLHGAAGGWMITLGSVTPDVQSLARLQKIELLDGRTLWTEIKPLLEPALRDEIMVPVRTRATRHLLLAWAAAAVAGIAVFVQGGREPASPEPTAVAPRATATASAAAPPASTPRVPSPTPEAVSAPVPADPAALAERRRKVANAIATLPWVDRALWSTQSTLVVHLAGESDADKEALCALVEPYAELRASRLQLQPPRESERPVRFIQCRTY